MTLPVYLSSSPLEGVTAGSTLTVGAEVAGHAVRVRRMGAGEDLDIIDGTGTRVRGTITAADNESVTLTVAKVFAEQPAHPRLVLVQALAKGDRDLQAIEAATEVGVDEVIPWSASRSIADWPAKKAEKMAAKWRNLLIAATLQSRRSIVPTLGGLLRGNVLDTLCTENSLVLILHEEAAASLPEALTQASANPAIDTIYLVVGPEGGITSAEVDRARAQGARTVVLGPTVLRASTAGPVALGIVQTLLGRWGALG